MSHSSNPDCVEVVISDDKALRGKEGHDGCDGKRAPRGEPETTITFGAPRLISSDINLAVPIDPMYLAFNGTAFLGPGLDATVPLTGFLAAYTYVAQNRSNSLDVSASIEGGALGAPVNLVVTVLSSSEQLLHSASGITMAEPFSTFGGIKLKVRPGNLIRVTAAAGMTLTQRDYSGIMARLRFYTRQH